MSIGRFLVRLVVLLGPSFFIIGCAGDTRNQGGSDGGGGEASAQAGEPAPRKVALILGTSLTAGYGLDPDQAYPAFLQEKVDSAGLNWEVVNAGVSGETSAGARGRVRWILEQPFDVLVLETGANDMLRGTNLDSLRANLQSIIDTVRAARPATRIVLVGMQAAPNLGREYSEEFGTIYPELAQKNNLTFIPFLLQSVGGIDSLNQEDAIHPTERGHRILAETVWKTLEPVLREEARRPRSAS